MQPIRGRNTRVTFTFNTQTRKLRTTTFDSEWGSVVVSDVCVLQVSDQVTRRWTATRAPGCWWSPDGTEWNTAALYPAKEAQECRSLPPSSDMPVWWVLKPAPLNTQQHNHTLHHYTSSLASVQTTSDGRTVFNDDLQKSVSTVPGTTENIFHLVSSWKIQEKHSDTCDTCNINHHVFIPQNTNALFSK